MEPTARQKSYTAPLEEGYSSVLEAAYPKSGARFGGVSELETALYKQFGNIGGESKLSTFHRLTDLSSSSSRFGQKQVLKKMQLQKPGQIQQQKQETKQTQELRGRLSLRQGGVLKQSQAQKQGIGVKQTQGLKQEQIQITTQITMPKLVPRLFPPGRRVPEPFPEPPLSGYLRWKPGTMGGTKLSKGKWAFRSAPIIPQADILSLGAEDIRQGFGKHAHHPPPTKRIKKLFLQTLNPISMRFPTAEEFKRRRVRI
jgi:hypothetical protein